MYVVTTFCGCGCGRHEGLVSVTLYDDLLDGEDWRESYASYCHRSLALAGGVGCERHGPKRLFRVPDALEPEGVRLVSVCFECLVAPVDSISPEKRRALVAKLDQGGVRLLTMVAEKADAGWFAEMDPETRVLAGALLFYAPHLEPGDTAADAIETYVQARLLDA